MGPQLYRCGNGLLYCYIPIRVLTSMGPQLYRCGNAEQDALHTDDMAASMGPQLYRCGNPAANKNNAVRIYKLQWGRNFIVAEIDADIIDLYAATMLQWDRNFIVAETSAPMTNARAKLVSLQWGRNFIVAETRPSI